MNLVLLLAALLLQPLLAVPRLRRGSVWAVASYNVSGVDKTGAMRRIGELALRHPRLTFIGFQEGRWLGEKAVPKPLAALGWKRSTNTYAPTQVWFRNRRGFTDDDSGVVLLAPGANRWIEPAAAGPTHASVRRINWVSGRQDGVKIVKASLHLVPSVQLPKADALSEAQMADVAAFVAYWIAHGYDVVLVGDFNLTPGHQNLSPLLQLKVRLANINAGWTHRGSPKEKGRLIDHVYVTLGLEVVSAEVLEGHRDDDHRIPLVRLRMRIR